MPLRYSQQFMRLQAQAPARVTETILERGLRVGVTAGAVHWLQEEMAEGKRLERGRLWVSHERGHNLKATAGVSGLFTVYPLPLCSYSLRPAVPKPVARTGSSCCNAIGGVGEGAAVEGEAAAADAFGQAGLEALELGDALIDP